MKKGSVRGHQSFYPLPVTSNCHSQLEIEDFRLQLVLPPMRSWKSEAKPKILQVPRVLIFWMGFSLSSFNCHRSVEFFYVINFGQGSFVNSFPFRLPDFESIVLNFTEKGLLFWMIFSPAIVTTALKLICISIQIAYCARGPRIM